MSDSAIDEAGALAGPVETLSGGVSRADGEWSGTAGEGRRSLDAVVTNVDSRGAVGGMRGLGRAGLRVGALASGRGAAGMWSRFAAARAIVPDPLLDPAGFVSAVGNMDREHGPLVVYPGSELAIDALLARASTLVRPRLPYSGPRALQLLRDKRTLAEVAREAGVRTPPELVRGRADELVASPPPLPCVVKAARPNLALPSARVVHSPAELQGLLKGLPPQEPLLVQERLRGPLQSLALVVDRDGGVAARFQSLASRTWPPRGGPSALATGVEPDEELVRRCAHMLHTAGYWGLAQLQFVGGYGEPALIDCNPRFYGSLPLALASGVNLPAAWHAVAVDGARPTADRYRVGVSYRWLEADLSAARHGDLRRVLRRAPAPRAGAMWASDDPIPGLLMGKDALMTRIRGRLPRPRGSRVR